MLRTAVALLWLVVGGVAVAAPRIGFVRVSDIHERLASTEMTQREIAEARQQVLRDARLDAYKAVVQELEAVRQQLAKVGGSPANRTKLEQNYVIKRQEAMVLQREFEEFRQKRFKEINADLVRRTEESLAAIHAKAAEVGKSKGLDLVIDSSGNTNTGLPFVLYSKDPRDITSDVLAALGQPLAETASGTTR